MEDNRVELEKVFFVAKRVSLYGSPLLRFISTKYSNILVNICNYGLLNLTYDEDVKGVRTKRMLTYSGRFLVEWDDSLTQEEPPADKSS